MSRVLKLILGTAFAGVLMGGGVMAAQPGAPPPAAAPSPPPVGTPPSDADVSVRQRPTLSPQDMLSQARDNRARMEGLIKQIQALSEEARRAKDVIRLNCLADKLAQLKANLGVADKGLQDLQDAINRRNEGDTLHEYGRITIINQKSQVLGSEAQACVGEDLAFVGATRLDVEAPGITPEDPTKPPPAAGSNPPNFVVDRPPSASPMGDG